MEDRVDEAAALQHSDDDIFQGMQPEPDLGFLGDSPSGHDVDAYIEELLNGTLACTHTHVCNPPGPDQEHTHSCQHTHTRLLTPMLPAESEADDQKSSDKDANGAASKKRKPVPPANNREAVRKYRERKKARTEYLEGEVARLSSINAQLVRRLQGQTAMAAELRRLRGLLSDLQRTINREMSAPVVPLGGPADAGAPLAPADFFTTSVEVPCHQDISCLHQPLPSKRLHAPGARRPEDPPGMLGHDTMAHALGPIREQANPGVLRGRGCKPDG